jgi:hypothetical protein
MEKVCVTTGTIIIINIVFIWIFSAIGLPPPYITSTKNYGLLNLWNDLHDAGIEWNIQKRFLEQRILQFNILENRNYDCVMNVCLFREPDPCCDIMRDTIRNVAETV